MILNNDLEKQIEDIVLKDLQEPTKLIEKLNDYKIEIGVISKDTKRKEKISVGLTNAEIMYIHENSSPIRNIPRRPVLEMTIDWCRKELMEKTINKIIEKVYDANWTIVDIENELNRMCVRMENYCREIIYSNDGRLAPNAPSVAKKKKGNHPLFDTGQLARSITCKLVKKV